MDSPRLSWPQGLLFWISPFLPPFEDSPMDAEKPAGCFLFRWGFEKAPGGLPSGEMRCSSEWGLMELGKKAVKAPA